MVATKSRQAGMPRLACHDPPTAIKRSNNPTGPVQHPRQIDLTILSTLAFSRSMAGLVPSSGPLIGPLPTPDDESAVPSELVPGVWKASPVVYA